MQLHSISLQEIHVHVSETGLMLLGNLHTCRSILGHSRAFFQMSPVLIDISRKKVTVE